MRTAASSEWISDKARSVRTLSLFSAVSATERGREWVAASTLTPLILALAGLWIGHGWIGHGLYKFALLALPFVFGMRVALPTKPRPRDLALAIGSGCLLGAVAAALIVAVLPRVADPAALRAAFDARYGYTPASAIAVCVLLACVNSLLEEWFYRGFLDPRLGPLATSIVFGLQHVIVLGGIAGLMPALAAGAACAAAGLVWSLLAWRGGIVLSFLSHALTDMILLAAGLRLLGYL